MLIEVGLQVQFDAIYLFGYLPVLDGLMQVLKVALREVRIM